jgi:hypothetical protein
MFWVQGRVAAQGFNFYESRHALELAEAFGASSAFKQEIYFWYPPQSMLLFAPLGWFSLNTAAVFWYGIQTLLLAAGIVLLWQLFLKDTGVYSLLLIGALILVFRGTVSTFQTGQTNLLLLCLVLLTIRYRSSYLGGVWLTLGIFTKVFAIILLIFVVVRRKWRVLAGLIVSTVSLSLITVGAFGLITFTSYFNANPTANAPDYLYTENANQSLLATVLRLTDYNFSGTSPLTYPLFLIPALIFGVITVWIVYRLGRKDDELALLLLLSLALVVYPASLEHYSVLLLVPALLMWSRRQMLPGGVWSVVVCVTAIYGLVGVSSGNYTFYAYVITWVVLTGISIWTLRHPTTE